MTETKDAEKILLDLLNENELDMLEIFDNKEYVYNILIYNNELNISEWYSFSYDSFSRCNERNIIFLKLAQYVREEILPKLKKE